MASPTTPYQRFMKNFCEQGFYEEEIYEFEYGGKLGLWYCNGVCDMFKLTLPKPSNRCLCGVPIDHNFMIYRARDKKTFVSGSCCIRNWTKCFQKCTLCMTRNVKGGEGKELPWCAPCTKRCSIVVKHGAHKGKSVWNVVTNHPRYCEFLRHNIEDWNVKRREFVEIVKLYESTQGTRDPKK